MMQRLLKNGFVTLKHRLGKNVYILLSSVLCEFEAALCLKLGLVSINRCVLLNVYLFLFLLLSFFSTVCFIAIYFCTRTFVSDVLGMV